MAAVFSRRTALQLSGALIVSFAIPLERGVGASQPAKKPVDPGSVESFLAINPDGTVTVFSGKVDLGTGLRTALTQMVADELDVGFSKVILIQGDTDLTPDQGVTFGSLSIQNGGVQLRQAAATARRALLIDEGLLQGMQPLWRTQPFERRYIALDHADWINARANRAAVQVHGAGATLAQTTTKARSVQLQIISEEIKQRHRRIVAVRDDLFAVHAKLKLRHALDLGSLCGAASLAPKPPLRQILHDFIAAAFSRILQYRA